MERRSGGLYSKKLFFWFPLALTFFVSLFYFCAPSDSVDGYENILLCTINYIKNEYNDPANLLNVNTDRYYDLLYDERISSGKKPLVIVLHGFGMNTSQMKDVYALPKIIKENDIILALPLGSSEIGNSCAIRTWKISPEENADTEMLKKMIEDIPLHLPPGVEIDHDRIYYAGFSIGGIMIQRAACDPSVPMTGFISLAGPISKDLAASTDCRINASRIKNTGYWYAAGDQIHNPEGGYNLMTGVQYLSAYETARFWSSHTDRRIDLQDPTTRSPLSDRPIPDVEYNHYMPTDDMNEVLFRFHRRGHGDHDSLRDEAIMTEVLAGFKI